MIRILADILMSPVNKGNNLDSASTSAHSKIFLGLLLVAIFIITKKSVCATSRNVSKSGEQSAILQQLITSAIDTR